MGHPASWMHHLVLSFNDGTDGSQHSAWSEAPIDKYQKLPENEHGILWEHYYYNEMQDEFDLQREFGLIDEMALRELAKHCAFIWIGPGRKEDCGFLLDVRAGIAEKFTGKDAYEAALRMGFKAKGWLEPLFDEGTWPRIVEVPRSWAMKVIGHTARLPTPGMQMLVGVAYPDGSKFNVFSRAGRDGFRPHHAHYLHLVGRSGGRYMLECTSLDWWCWGVAFGEQFGVDSLFMDRWSIFDNGGETLDRITVFPYIKSKVRDERRMYVAVDGAGGRGFSQWGEADLRKCHYGKSMGGMGKRVLPSEIPIESLRHVYYRAMVQ